MDREELLPIEQTRDIALQIEQVRGQVLGVEQTRGPSTAYKTGYRLSSVARTN